MITIEKLHFSYSKKKSLFTDLNLELQAGKIYGLLGKNGTGKSSLLKLIIGVLFPNEGKISIEAFDSVDRRPEILQDIFFLSEDYELPSIKIKSYVNANKALYSKFDEAKFYEYLQMFEVDVDSNLQKLSYGQKKKVLISFGIATNAKYLLLDEPTNGLDIPSKSQFRKVLLAGFKDDQIMIISTHQIRDLNQLIESIIIIENGKIIFKKDVFELEEKLRFTKSLSEESGSNTVYSESVAGGYIHIQPNEEGIASEVELEVLFNAVIKDNDVLNKIV